MVTTNVNIISELKSIREEISSLKEEIHTLRDHEFERYLVSDQFQKDRAEIQELKKRIDEGKEELIEHDDFWKSLKY